jgi:nucleoside-diphosphate kinase
MVKEKTFIAIKSEAIQRHLIGEIIQRFEKRGLKLIAMKMMVATKEIIGKHYPDDDAWYIPTGTKTIEGYKQRGISVDKSPKEVAQKIRTQLIEYFSDRPLICMVWEGAHAVQIGRKTVGSTNPLEAAPGTIRGDFTVDSYELADANDRNVRTIVHASGNVKEAEEEIKLWFSADEIIDYDMVSSKILYDNDWGRINK